MNHAAHVPVPEPRIKRFEKLGFGMFIHWGIYSQLGKGEWVQHVNNIPMSEYSQLKNTFTANHFNAKEIVATAKRAGMKYIVITCRHHDGFSLYDLRGLHDYDALHSPAKRDLIAELVTACREQKMVPMFYHTTLDWYQDSYKTDFNAYLDYLYQSVEILCKYYGEIGGFWFDGNWNKPDADWKLDELYGMIRKYQPEAIIINNTGLNHRGKVGHSELDSVTYERGRPEPMNQRGWTKYIAAEMCETINEHWGVSGADFMYKSIPYLIESLCACRKVRANYLLNIGLTSEGAIIPLQKAMLETIGDWLNPNAKPVYEGKPANVDGQHSNFALETEDGKLYLFIHHLKISGHSQVTLENGGEGVQEFTGLNRKAKSVRWLDAGTELPFKQDLKTGSLRFHATNPYGSNYVVRVAEVNFV